MGKISYDDKMLDIVKTSLTRTRGLPIVLIYYHVGYGAQCLRNLKN